MQIKVFLLDNLNDVTLEFKHTTLCWFSAVVGKHFFSRTVNNVYSLFRHLVNNEKTYDINIFTPFNYATRVIIINQHAAFVNMHQHVLFGITALIQPKVSKPGTLCKSLTIRYNLSFGGNMCQKVTISLKY